MIRNMGTHRGVWAFVVTPAAIVVASALASATATHERSVPMSPGLGGERRCDG